MDYKHDPDTDFAPPNDLSVEQAAEQAEALRSGIRHHDYLYYVRNAPEISDAVYDRLLRRLQALEQAFPSLRRDDSPTRRVGAEPVSGLDEVEHAAVMLSLEAAVDGDAVRDFVNRVGEDAGGRPRLNLEPKFDGFSVELVYVDGRLRTAATRGNGEQGEDITHNLRTVRAIPLRLRAEAEPPQRLAVRGEVFMTRRAFTEVNRRRVERGDDAFANPRNAAAGMMRQLDPRKLAGVPFDAFFYQVLAIDGPLPATHAEVLARLDDWGLKTCPLNACGSDYAAVRDYHRRLAARRDALDYEIDGIVVEVDDLDLRRTLGARSRNPRWALAWKFAPREEVTRIDDIVVQVGRTGILTPVALLQPVDVGGVTVSRATLHNADEVRRKDVRVGDKVRLVRAGDVIPEVASRVKTPGRKRAQPFRMPAQCPVCATELVRQGAYVVCPAGLSCAAQLVGRLCHYAGRDAMDIDHLGEETARRLVDSGLVEDLADLYTLDVDDIEGLEGFAARSARQLHDAIRGSLAPRLDRFLYALGIRHVGRRTARLLARRFGGLDALLMVSADAVEAVPGLGPEVAGSVADFFADRVNRGVIERMRERGLAVRAMPHTQRDLDGLTFVFTGALDRRTRDEAREQVESRGGRATSSVSGETDYLVVGDDPGSKLDEARRRQVEILDEASFEKLLEGD
jgi:DNA ligase (NAD+)